MTTSAIHDSQILIHLSNSPTRTRVMARCKLSAGPASINHFSSNSHFTSKLRSPEKEGAVRREVGSVPISAVARRGPASSLDLECGPPLGAPWPGRFEDAFRRFAPHSAVGPRRCNLFRTLRHRLSRWGSSVQLPHFRLSPALAGLRLLLRSYLRSPATRHRLSQAPHSRSASGSLLKKRSLREPAHNSFCYVFVNSFYEWFITLYFPLGSSGGYGDPTFMPCS
jgi:hypothetical protein